MRIEPHRDDDEHDLLFRVFVRRHHVGKLTPHTGHDLIAKLKRKITVSSRGKWHVEVAEVASVTRTRGSKPA